MKRILIFSVAYYPSFIGGAEIAVKEITDRIDDLEFDMITLNLDGNQKREERIGNVMMYRIGGKGRMSKLLFPITACLKALNLHKERPYKAIWSIMASYSGFAALFFNFLKPQVPFILTLQEGDPIPYIKRKVRFVWPLFKRIFTRATRIQAISQYLKEFALSMKATAPIEVIPNGVDHKLFSQEFSKDEIKKIRSRWSDNNHDVILITTSRLVHKNGVTDIISALTFLPDHIKLVIVGNGPLEDQLRFQVKTLHFEKRVFFAGFIEYKKIPMYLASADIFVRPSLSEGMGNSFIEAMAAGLPVIATNVGGIGDFLKDHQTGFFCKVQNPRSIAERVEEIIEKPDLTSDITKKAKKTAQYYDWNLISEAMEEHILGVD